MLSLPQDILLLIFKTGVVPLFSDFSKLFFKSNIPCHVRSLKCVLLSQQSPSHVSWSYLNAWRQKKKKKRKILLSHYLQLGFGLGVLQC